MCNIVWEWEKSKGSAVGSREALMALIINKQLFTKRNLCSGGFHLWHKACGKPDEQQWRDRKKKQGMWSFALAIQRKQERWRWRLQYSSWQRWLSPYRRGKTAHIYRQCFPNKIRYKREVEKKCGKWKRLYCMCICIRLLLCAWSLDCVIACSSKILSRVRS